MLVTTGFCVIKVIYKIRIDYTTHMPRAYVLLKRTVDQLNRLSALSIAGGLGHGYFTGVTWNANSHRY